MKQPWVAIQRNPRSGSGSGRRQVMELIAQLRRLGFRPRVFSRREVMEARFQNPAYRENLACVVAAGGDGTVNDVMNRFPGVRLAVLPLGTENLLAREFGIVRSGRVVAQMISAGKTRKLDVCTLGTRRFLLMASMGFDADVVHRLHEKRSGNITQLTYLQPIWHSLRRYEYPELRVYVNGADHPLSGRLLLVSNLPAYALRLPVARAARGDDGLVDLRLFQPRSALAMMRVMFMVATGRHETAADVTSLRAQTIRVEADQPVPIQIDGDPGGWTPAEINVMPGALELVVPDGRPAD